MINETVDLQQVFIQAILMSITRQKHSILLVSFETQSLFCLFVVFAYLQIYWNSFATAILEMKIKKYLHVSYMQLFDFFTCITYITY